ncbi:MAG TPA: permease-like cell division protein FtsX [Cytophagaceae bacterium]|jgi:cell division transport system permease protein|nr:permease-like cell division protein FtsX [Cytophagaceae bacterium]
MPQKVKSRKKKLGSYPYLTVVFSMTMALFVIGLFAVIFVHANKLSGIIKEKIEIHVYLNNELSENKIQSLNKIITSQPYVLKKNNTPQLIYISQDSAAKKFIQDTGENFYKVLKDNPVRGSITVKLNPAYSDSTHMKKIVADLQNMEGVFEVDYQENLISRINSNIKSISLIFIGFAAILLTASVLLINNTIKLALFSQRFLIRSMQLVGATKTFIQMPFLIRAILQGLFSGIIAASVLAILIQYAYSEINDLIKLQETETVIIILGSLLILGIIIGLLSSFRAINTYLKMSLDELY